MDCSVASGFAFQAGKFLFDVVGIMCFVGLAGIAWLVFLRRSK